MYTVNGEDINQAVNTLNFDLLTLFDRHAPVKSFIPRNRPCPWITIDLRRLIRERDRLRRVCCCSATPRALAEYRAARNDVKSRLITARENHYRSLLLDITNPKDLWDKMRKMGIVKRNRTTTSLPFSVNDYNQYLLTVFQPPNHDPSSVIDEADNLEFSDTRFYFQDISPVQLVSAIFSFSTGATGVDGISINLIKKSCGAILLP